MGNSQAAPDKDNVKTETPFGEETEDGFLMGKETSEGGVHTVNGSWGRGVTEADQSRTQKTIESNQSSPSHRSASASASPAGPSMGMRVGKNPLGSGPVNEGGYAMDSPDGLMMPAGSDSAIGTGTALPSDSHGYSGERDELGQRHGDGVQLFPDGRRYSGQFEFNTFHGAGIMVWPDGHRYTGQYENNHKSGDGFFLWPDGRFYDGQWKMGQRHGHGQYISSESYVGDYHEGFRHGDGVLTWPDGKRYAGQFFRGSLHGSAVMSWPDGRRYLGQYADNQKQGEGIFYWPDGRLYEGQWKRGLRHGSSRFIDNSGEEHVGNWHKDRLVSSDHATNPGIRDPFCEPPVTLLTKRHKQPQLDGIAEEPFEDSPGKVSSLRRSSEHAAREGGAGAMTPETQQALSAQDVTLEEKPEAKPEGVVTVNGVDHTVLELHELRNMQHHELRDHAHHLHGSFGHHGTPVPEHDHALLGWIYEVQSRHLRPLLDAAIYEISDGHWVMDGAITAIAAASETADRLGKASRGAASFVSHHITSGDDDLEVETAGLDKDFKDVDAGLQGRQSLVRQSQSVSSNSADTPTPGAYPEPADESYLQQEAPPPPPVKEKHQRRVRPDRLRSKDQEVK